jgi:hypothetical protein
MPQRLLPLYCKLIRIKVKLLFTRQYTDSAGIKCKLLRSPRGVFPRNI